MYGIANPIDGMRAPKLGKPILPSLEQQQVLFLLDQTDNLRNKAIISLFAESGLRLSELVDIKLSDIDWQHRIIKVVGKGNKEAYAPFGEQTKKYLRDWLTQYQPIHF